MRKVIIRTYKGKSKKWARRRGKQSTNEIYARFGNPDDFFNDIADFTQKLLLDMQVPSDIMGSRQSEKGT
jgi:hypothetical protein